MLKLLWFEHKKQKLRCLFPNNVNLKLFYTQPACGSKSDKTMLSCSPPSRLNIFAGRQTDDENTPRRLRATQKHIRKAPSFAERHKTKIPHS